MKIYDKKGFVTAIIGFGTAALLTALSSYINEGTVNLLPSGFIFYMTIKYILESISEEKSRINMERERRKNRVIEEYYGAKGKVISNVLTIAMYACCLVLCFNFGAGLAVFVAILVLNSIVFKPVNAELRKINEEANQRKSEVKKL